MFFPAPLIGVFSPATDPVTGSAVVVNAVNILIISTKAILAIRHIFVAGDNIIVYLVTHIV